MEGKKVKSNSLLAIDSHCHLQSSEFYDDETRESAYRQSIDAGIGMICVGTDVRSSYEAVEFARTHDDCWAIVGIHPHDVEKEGDDGVAAIETLLSQRAADMHGRPVVVGVGEIGLDYFYDNSPRQAQRGMLQRQLVLARRYDVPVSFHVRDEKSGNGAVWRDFWPIFDEMPVRGVLHSFTDTEENLRQGLQRGLYIGVNGISTFTKDSTQQQMYADLSLDSMLIETDAPFLTPHPFRGRINVPAFVVEVARDQAMKKHRSVDCVYDITQANTRRLFHL